MTRYVANHRAHSMIAETKQIVKITAHPLRWHHSRRDDRVRRDDRLSGKKLHLQIVGKLHLVDEPLLRERRAHESRVLNRRTDLRGDSGNEFLIAGGER